MCILKNLRIKSVYLGYFSMDTNSLGMPDHNIAMVVDIFGLAISWFMCKVFGVSNKMDLNSGV